MYIYSIKPHKLQYIPSLRIQTKERGLHYQSSLFEKLNSLFSWKLDLLYMKKAIWYKAQVRVPLSVYTSKISKG